MHVLVLKMIYRQLVPPKNLWELWILSPSPDVVDLERPGKGTASGGLINPPGNSDEVKAWKAMNIKNFRVAFFLMRGSGWGMPNWLSQNL